MFPTLSKVAIFTWFKTNQNWIAKELCINKNTDKADLCAGCCVLEDKLEKVNDEPSPKSDSASKIQKEEFSPFIAEEIEKYMGSKSSQPTQFPELNNEVSEKHVELGLKPPTKI